MADTQTIVALNIGSQRISLAVFEVSKHGTLVLKAYDADTIVADPSFEASRESQIRVALEEMVGKLGISKSKVRYALSSQSVFLRFVKLPPIKDDNIEQLVVFEARQHVPFPLNEVVWDYELIETDAEKEVVIVAIKADELEEINDTVNASGLVTAEVDVAPMALYNAFRSAYGVLEEPTLIIDIGAKTSNLLYVEGKRFFTRSVQIGGASITSAIAREYQVSFAEAEHQKTHNGIVALGGGHTESLDESVAALAVVIRNALTRLPAEIARTTNYYRSQHGGSSPKRVLLAGGGANLPYTLEFLSEKLDLQVEFFNPLSQIAISKEVDLEILQQEAHMMGELVGLGLRGIGKSSIHIDLVPPAVEQMRDSDRRKPFFVAAAVVWTLGFAIWAGLQQAAAVKAVEKAHTMTEVSETLSPQAAMISKLLKDERELDTLASAYTSIQADHDYWFDVLGEIRQAFANDSVWLTELTPIYGYNPVPTANPGTTQPPIFHAIPKNFSSNASGIGSMIHSPPVVKEEEAPRQRRSANRSGKPVEESPKQLANAIYIRGFWRENPRRQNIVSDLLKNLRESSTMFTFNTMVDRKEMILSDEQLLKPAASGGEDDLGYPFELILPLARPVAVK
ncbi:MAG: type pilus assembly protein PilM [Verrucomicrobiota bacterium]|jgi:type IV pilus assembly protein PilM